ncbi:hypothetical protein IQ238_01600 [Pleurocapsales cyanobacterium LEGE 06147]|nr:hypothetical protein [Pleurocapsales cyanobacterium LEGE 06147]
MQISELTCPISRYCGERTPDKLVFNAHFQIFSHRVSTLCALHTNGKISSNEVYQELRELWAQLEPYYRLIANSRDFD